jgi:hypothetical protein
VFFLFALFLACVDKGGPPVQPRERAPRFTLPSASGPLVSIDDYIDRKPVLLYFSMGPG